MTLTFDLLTSKSSEFIFVPNCTYVVILVKFIQAISKISCSQTFSIWSCTHMYSLKTECFGCSLLPKGWKAVNLTNSRPDRTKSIHIRQVDFITEQHQPLVELHRWQNKSVRSLAIFAVMIESLQHQFRRSSTGEVQSNNLHNTHSVRTQVSGQFLYSTSAYKSHISAISKSCQNKND